MVCVISARKKRNGEVNITLDQGISFNTSESLAVRHGLREGLVIEDADLEKLIADSKLQLAREKALRYLGPRPRSEAELRTRLRSYAIDNEVIEQVLSDLRRRGVLDDSAFATFWCQNREDFSPRSRKFVQMELRQKGLDNDVIEEAVGSIDDETNAYKLAKKKASRIKDQRDFRQKLSAFLGRRGFDHALIRQTVERIWQERTTQL